MRHNGGAFGDRHQSFRQVSFLEVRKAATA